MTDRSEAKFFHILNILYIWAKLKFVNYPCSIYYILIVKIGCYVNFLLINFWGPCRTSVYYSTAWKDSRNIGTIKCASFFRMIRLIWIPKDKLCSFTSFILNKPAVSGKYAEHEKNINSQIPTEQFHPLKADSLFCFHHQRERLESKSSVQGWLAVSISFSPVLGKIRWLATILSRTFSCWANSQ